MPDAIQRIPLQRLSESPLNHRRHFGDLSEMTESIRQQGVLHPILARPTLKKGAFELVFGHRRLRAARAAGLKDIPAIVRVMSDVEVLEAQLAENIAREDVHPLELAEGYRDLMTRGKLTAEQVADRLGISRSTVFGTMKLLDLSDEAKKAFLAGRISGAQAAVAIARVQGERQQKAALEAIEKEQQRLGGPLPSRAVQRLVQSRFAAKTSRTEQRLRAEREGSGEDGAQAREIRLMLSRVRELVERQPTLGDEVVRLLLVALAGDPAAAQELAYLEAGPDRVGGLKGGRLRSALVDVLLWRWARTEGADRMIAKVFGLDMTELRKTAAALRDAEAVVAPGGSR